MFHLDRRTGGTDPVVTWYTPDGLLYDILSDEALEWCGGSNRHSRHAWLEIKPCFPAQDVFVKLRRLAIDYEHPVVLLYGRPDIVPTEARMDYQNMQYHQGVMGILFRPGDGRSTRVHFNATDDGPPSSETPRVHLHIGECGEYGPLHPWVRSGHELLSSKE
jgi:hypothetical protein